jgi:hypothetical protein
MTNRRSQPSRRSTNPSTRHSAGRSAGRAVGRTKGRTPGDLEKGFYIAAISFAVALTALLAHGATYGGSPWPNAGFRHPEPRIVSASAHSPVYGRAMLLAARYDSRPYWQGPRLTAGAPTSRDMADLAIEHLIPCESGGKAVNHLDSNGKMSYGILQFQDWREWERISGISGDPDNRDDAIRMAEWGIQHGMIDHWTCARILGEF